MNQQFTSAVMSGMLALATALATVLPAVAQLGGGTTTTTGPVITNTGNGGIILNPINVTATVMTAYHYSSPNGVCPDGAQFNASIQVDKKCTVKYAWITSDTQGNPTYQTLVFDGPGSKSESLYITATDDNPNRSGYVAIKVISPTATESNHYSFSLSCTSKSQLDANPNVVIKRH